ncbi:hypothetical protein [Planococcus sp. YIM B11945]|uniref:hypothetical protein n=1 Tax=Planococcus sp. YIM B11945 TaxID=3435410 RepID=UPI003D7D16D3
MIGTVLWIFISVIAKMPHAFNFLNLTESNAEAHYPNGRLKVNGLKNECVILCIKSFK